MNFETEEKTQSITLKRVQQIIRNVCLVTTLSIIVLIPFKSSAHCDSYDGPVIKDAIQALKTNNVSLVLKWVSNEYENEIIELFQRTYELKQENSEFYSIVEEHFLETLVRLHRATEGEGYTGLKPSGSISPIIEMADKSIENENIDQLVSKLTLHVEKVLNEKYQNLMLLNRIKDESIEQGRNYVSAYVDYMHTIESIHIVLENDIGNLGLHNHHD